MGDGGTQVLFARVGEFIGRIRQYLNPVGQFYVQFQILCRVLVCTVFLDDLFEEEGLGKEIFYHGNKKMYIFY